VIVINESYEKNNKITVFFSNTISSVEQ